MSKTETTITVVPASALFSGVYTRLKAMAGKHRARAGSPVTYSTTEIVHDLYLRMGFRDYCETVVRVVTPC